MVRSVRMLYLVLIPLTLGFMFLHHLGDFLRKLWRLRLSPPKGVLSHLPAPAASDAEMRMYGLERLQHGLLVVSFTVLVWTGFALKYPDAWWARPLVMWEANWPVRGTIHRIAAVIMMAVGVGHVISLGMSRRLRGHWLELIPRGTDAVEALQMLFYNLGLREKKPHVSAHSYVEKAEYWAVVWGVFIMGLTGLALWFHRYTLAWLPKEWLDVATSVHFYEAVLASLAIVIWHFYTVILDPDVYPLDPAWLTGFSVRKREAHKPARRPEGGEETNKQDGAE
jgi:cytochrome b subunit of formate dehydrogenase